MDDSWPTCDQDGCSGARTGDETRCLAHAGAKERATTLERFSKGGGLDVRGVTISDALFEEILDAAPHDGDGHRIFSAAKFCAATFEGDAQFGEATFEGAQFGEATFEGDAQFRAATFKGDAQFSGATFKGDAGFEQATFKGDAWFERAMFNGDDVMEGFDQFGRATFKGVAQFVGAKFEGDALFDRVTFEGFAWLYRARFERSAQFGLARFKGAGFRGATFKGDAGFGWARFEGDAQFGLATFKRAGFGRATFKGGAEFDRATFEGDAGFEWATFEGDAQFSEVTFEGDAGFSGARLFGGTTFKGDVQFVGATFKGDVPVLGPIAVGGKLDLDGVQFASAVRIETDGGGDLEGRSPSTLSCRRGRFPGGVRLDVRRALVRLDDTDLSVPSLLTGPPASDPAGKTGQPKLLSLQRANAAGLALGNVDLADCRFAGAHNLDELRLEADTVFGFSPAIAGWERRQVVAEEAAWRAARARRRGWNPPQWPDSEGDEPEVLSPGAIAGLYRALRKGREDAKDEPGAADFYYGEMEMRRHDRGKDAIGDQSRGRVSRIVLTAYWLLSGYGLRAWRSLAALVVVLAVSAAVFRLWGFTRPTPYWKSLLFAFRSTVSLTDSQVNLTAWGGLFQVILRLTGPVLLALTLLALRGRVKR